MKNQSFIYFLSAPDSHIAFAMPVGGGQILCALGHENEYESCNSFGIYISPHTEPCKGWVVTTQEEYEKRKALALRFLGLIDQDASFQAQIEAHEAQEFPY